jgi:hypothetical protein
MKLKKVIEDLRKRHSQVVIVAEHGVEADHFEARVELVGIESRLEDVFALAWDPALPEVGSQFVQPIGCHVARDVHFRRSETVTQNSFVIDQSPQHFYVF